MDGQDETPSRLLRKLKIFLAVGSGILSILLVGGYFLTQSLISSVPLKLKNLLEAEGIAFDYQTTKSFAGGFGIEMSDVLVSGNPLPVKANVGNISLKISFLPQLRPVVIELHFLKSVLKKNPPPLAASPPQKKSSSPKTGAWIGLVTKFIRTKIHIEDVSAEEFGFKHAHYQLSLEKLSSDSNRTPIIVLQHDLRIEEVLQIPSLNGLALSGTLQYHPPHILLAPQKVSIGPFSTIFSSKVNSSDLTWSITSDIPKTDLLTTPLGFSKSLLQYMQINSGTLLLKADLSGKGADPNTITGSGALELSNFKSKVDHPFSDGNISGSLKASFSKNPNLQVSITSNIELADLMFRYEKYFYKERGVPLNLNLVVKANDKQIQIEPSEFKFHSLFATFNGNLAVNPKEASTLTFNVAPTDLVRWERFFPNQTSIKTSGSVAASGSFSGSLENWKNGKLVLDLKANDVHIPVLPEWNTTKQTKIAGSVNLNSVTRIELDNGTIRTLATDSSANLSNTELSYGAVFRKPKGARMNVDLLVKSSASKAAIKKGVLDLGPLKIKAVGSINNFKNPTVALSIDSSPATLSQLLEFCPSFTPKNISQIEGLISLKSKISGPLLTKAGPSVQGIVAVNKLSLAYAMDQPKKKIVVRNISGPIVFSNDSISSKKLFFSFPKTNGTAAFSIRNFSTPIVSLDINAPVFSISDFYDLPKNSKIPPGAIPVPVSNNESHEDFRKNPFLRNLSLNGSMNITTADLGYATAQNVTAKVSFEKMALSISPFKMDLFGGSIISNTKWNGIPEIPLTKQTIRVTQVNANEFLSTYSDSAKNVIDGKFSTDMSLAFAGIKADAIKKSIEGQGTFTLKDGHIKTIRFTKGPLESLQKIPKLGQNISKTDWDERLNDATGSFKLKNGQLGLSNLVLHSPYFEVKASEGTLDMNQNILASIVLTPHLTMLTGDAQEMLKDETGRASLPLTLSGNIMSPTVALNSDIIQNRMKQFAERRLATEKDKAVQAARQRAEEEGKRKVQDALKNSVPKGLGNLF